MENSNRPREHHNLYYIFEADKKAHPMSPEMTEKIRKNILNNFSKTVSGFVLCELYNRQSRQYHRLPTTAQRYCANVGGTGW